MTVKTLLWQEVKSVHNTIAGIYSRSGMAVSLLCNTDSNGPYPNKVSDKEIIYYFGPGTQIWGINALLKVMEKSGWLRVFQKLGKNRWLDLGYWSPIELLPEIGGYWPVKLVPKKRI